MRSLANGCWMLLMGQDLGHFSWMKTIMKTLGSWWVLMSPGPRHVGQPPAKKTDGTRVPSPGPRSAIGGPDRPLTPTAGSSCLVSTKLYRDPNAQPKDLQSRSSKILQSTSLFFFWFWGSEPHKIHKGGKGGGPRHHDFLLQGDHDNFTGRQSEGRLDLTWHSTGSTGSSCCSVGAVEGFMSVWLSDQSFPIVSSWDVGRLDNLAGLRWVFLVVGDSYHHCEEVITKNDTYSMINNTNILQQVIYSSCIFPKQWE